MNASSPSQLTTRPYYRVRRHRRCRLCRFLANSDTAGLRSKGYVPRVVLHLFDARVRYPRRRRRRLCRVLAASDGVGLKSTGRVSRSTLCLIDAPRSPSPPPSPPTLSFPCRLTWGGPQTHGTYPPQHPPPRRRPRSPSPPPLPPTLSFSRRFTWGASQIHGTCPPQHPLPRRRPRSPSPPASPSTEVSTVVLKWKGHVPCIALCFVNARARRPAAAPADFAVSLRIELGLASNEQDVPPAASSALSPPALTVPAAVGTDLAVSSLIHPGWASNQRDMFPAPPSASSTAALATIAAVAADLACRIGHPVSLHPELTHRAPSSEFMAVSNV
ncbi:hypothetical protein MSAN_02519500 [Mycena sanguinolenta]|uniref:Uncharacterized protein n=1 Tax=Mycena sanguinolenta TaxID=230812 RepID=A0A8H6WP26_9AGAR|nr:hypothetical protein MSAN_02519500 [Mycena sanguinolenta]